MPQSPETLDFPRFLLIQGLHRRDGFRTKVRPYPSLLRGIRLSPKTRLSDFTSLSVIFHERVVKRVSDFQNASILSIGTESKSAYEMAIQNQPLT